ncbi:FkbM family methyltransferase [Fontisphaera persica]|uniref:FkbM family methyltransferase n=1 Tax=Fontisphaera persica TaxID=2974023 RepID=UPI0024BFD620|nr:FkbM family methyltransferase [Fontisphaera persica]WCJ59683.1 FkbM family methyltransferase [Fontisphaera persica]
MLENCSQIYDTIIIDVQGAELEVLKGAKKTLKKIKYIITEASDYSAYKGCCTLNELADYLRMHGFRIKTKRKVRWKPGVGGEYDVMFVRK